MQPTRSTRGRSSLSAVWDVASGVVAVFFSRKTRYVPKLQVSLGVHWKKCFEGDKA